MLAIWVAIARVQTEHLTEMVLTAVVILVVIALQKDHPAVAIDLAVVAALVILAVRALMAVASTLVVATAVVALVVAVAVVDAANYLH